MKYKKLNCAPNQQHRYTCYTTDHLLHMRELWNNKHPHRYIESIDPKEIWRYFKKEFQHQCKQERCWITKHFKNIPNANVNSIFSPVAPKIWDEDPKYWLSNFDIEKVMKLYEMKYDYFTFLGATPVDYDTKLGPDEYVNNAMTNFDRKYYETHSPIVGIVINTHTNDKPGEHWCAMVIRFHKKECIFFDSYGDKAPRRIKRFVKDNIPDLNYIESKKRHQYGESECGMYCIYFIIEMLKGRNIDTLNKNIIRDKKMNNLRKELFNSYKDVYGGDT